MEIEDRIDLIKTAKKEGKKIVMYLVEDMKAAQFRYRVYNIMEMMEYYESDWQVVYFLNTEVEEALKNLNNVEFLVILRQAAKGMEILELIDEAHKKNKKVLFDVDDLVFDFKYLKILMQSTSSVNILYWLGYIYGVRRIARQADGFIATNEFLKGKIEESFKKPCEVIWNSLNNKQIRMFNNKKNKHEGFKIGYFSGSPTHKKDLKMIEADLVKFLDEHMDAHLIVYGYMEFSGVMWNQIRRGRVFREDLTGYLKMQTLLEEVDVNIAPLVINDFTNCKSELKFFEAAVAGTTTIASPTYTYSRAIKDGENGYLAESGEWYDKLETLYQCPETNRKVATNARKYALKNYYGRKFLKMVEDTYEHLA